jgi:hypothetical protein
LNVCISGNYSDYHLAISWRPDLGSLQLASVLDIRVPLQKRNEIIELLALINEQLWLGHFDMWSSDGAILFRNSMMVSGDVLSEGQCDTLIQNTLETCEKFFPAFQFLMWAGHSPKKAMESCLFETRGDA